MEKKHITINNNGVIIPAVLWGKPNKRLLIEVHGKCSYKEDTVISIMAEKAVSTGYQVLSFDLPMHGKRIPDKYECNPENCISDLQAVYAFAENIASNISLFACSMGAYFSLLAYHDLDLRQSLFLSPVVNMERLIDNMIKTYQCKRRET
ncbi:MAG: alpha/beta hydrolase [Methanomicrobiaceae archaeon]|nr:alpha/beta hydrolase [Methanomicrobiaceae archaeon]